MRSDDELRRCIVVTDVREQEERQESTAAAAHIDPPRSVHVVATVDVPAGVAGIAHAGEADRKGSTHPFAPRPTAGSEQRVVHLPERWRGARGRERGALGASEAYHRLRPGRG